MDQKKTTETRTNQQWEWRNDVERDRLAETKARHARLLARMDEQIARTRQLTLEIMSMTVRGQA